jgi:hypothetical protein
LAQSVVAPQFTSGTPEILNSENELTVSLPLLNIGSEAAANVELTDIILRSTTRLSPAGMPLFIGNLAPDNTAAISPRFDSRPLTVGSRYLLTVRGTYDVSGTVYGFAVNRYIVVPAASPPPVELLKARVAVVVIPGSWTYTIHNNEAPLSQQFIAAFSLDIVAPVTVIGTPEGWEVETDNSSYVLWVATDQQLPYPHHIAPGGSLGGFQIQSSSRMQSESTPYVVTAWNHQSDEAGLVSPDLVLSPSRD